MKAITMRLLGATCPSAPRALAGMNVGKPTAAAAATACPMNFRRLIPPVFLLWLLFLLDILRLLACQRPVGAGTII